MDRRSLSPRRHAAAIIVAALLLASLTPLLSTATAGGAASPAAAVPWWQRSTLDRNHDGLDDALAAELAHVGSSRPLSVLVDYAAQPTASQIRGLEAAGAQVAYRVHVIPVVVAVAKARDVPGLAAAPGVVMVEEDRPLHAVNATPARELDHGVRASKAFDVTGRNVTVAVFDTGIYSQHPDFAGKVVAAYDAAAATPLVDQLFGQAPVKNPSTEDKEGHGTHVAGLVAGTGAQSHGKYVGLAPGADLVNVKVFDASGNSSTSYVLNGIDWAVAHASAYRIKILQMSLGGPATDGTDALSRAIGAAADRGLLTVAAAGNSGPDAGTVELPGVSPRALTVGATDNARVIAKFSSRGPTPDGRRKPDVVAPGVGITSTYPPYLDGGSYYAVLSGTSMAAPQVSGIAALVWEANASLTPALVKWIITASTDRVGDTPDNWSAAYGWGFVNAYHAVKAAYDPQVLGAAPFETVARSIPLDQGSSPLSKLAYDAGSTGRSLVPGVSAGALLALAAVVALARQNRRR